MSDIQILDQSANGLHLQCGKQSAYFFRFTNSNRVQVIVQNASHKCWKGAGKFFDSFAQAKENYRSAEVKAMLDVAADKLKGE